ncbi:signal peptidase I [Streptomyces sp. TRM70308]|uniref:signal peptidase I n=1 Tax=Streptomyces sp. TRM70308 TaxID=3131932 RepID=UPI003CFEF5A3
MSTTATNTAASRGGPGRVASSIAVAVGCVLLVGSFVWAVVLYRPYAVPTDSMAPTINAGDRVLAERIEGAEVRRGDVVVFADPTWGDLPVAKRVIGVGGDEVVCCDAEGRLSVNGTPVPEPYRSGPGPASVSDFTARVPDDSLFLLGDNRRHSMDSRSLLGGESQGAVPREAVRARVDARAWPPGAAGLVERPAGFAGLPGGVSDTGPLPVQLAAAVVGAVLILGGAAYGPVARRAGRGRRH